MMLRRMPGNAPAEGRLASQRAVGDGRQRVDVGALIQAALARACSGAM
jgi:hypothetical protein